VSTKSVELSGAISANYLTSSGETSFCVCVTCSQTVSITYCYLQFILS
jgi:hypothetical protein